MILNMAEGNPIRLYTLAETEALLAAVGMRVPASYADFAGTPSSDNGIQLMACAEKLP